MRREPTGRGGDRRRGAAYGRVTVATQAPELGDQMRAHGSYANVIATRCIAGVLARRRTASSTAVRAAQGTRRVRQLARTDVAADRPSAPGSGPRAPARDWAKPTRRARRHRAKATAGGPGTLSNTRRRVNSRPRSQRPPARVAADRRRAAPDDHGLEPTLNTEPAAARHGSRSARGSAAATNTSAAAATMVVTVFCAATVRRRVGGESARLREPSAPAIASARMDHWEQLAGLPLVVESLAYGRLDPGPGFGEAHASRLVRLTGAGHEGLGEDITLFIGRTAPDLPLAGRVDARRVLRAPRRARPVAERPARVRRHDAPLAQLGVRVGGARPRAGAGRPAAARGDRARAPAGHLRELARARRPASADTILRRLERYPRLRFKLDAAVTWTPEIVGALVGTGAVHTIDFKGHYGMEVRPRRAARPLRAAAGRFPDALIEDPHDLPEIAALVEPHAARVSYDAPIHTVADLDAVPIRARTFNIKPSRVGRLRDLFALYDACEARGFAHVRRRHGRARRRPRADPAARRDVLARRAERHRAARLQRARSRGGPARQPAGPGPAAAGFRRRPDA